MTDEDKQPTGGHEPPAGASTTGTWGELGYTATAKWLVLHKDDKPAAEVFTTSYVAESDGARPVTFVFNGGPGAASAYLHLGLVGPQRVEFPPDGTMPASPPRLVPNEESWLAFTDLVFLDPVGTGFSRVIEPDGKGEDGKPRSKGVESDEYYGVARDLAAMGEAIGRWLSENKRWGSPIFVAGESYGGYRAGRLTRLLQEQSGIALCGTILISPAFEPAYLAATLEGTGDYDIVPWLDYVPTMAAAAAFHGRSRAFPAGTPVEEVQRGAEEFATGDYTTFLARGAAMPADERERTLNRLADLIGLDPEFVARAEGRITVDQFMRQLLRDEQKVVGRYDAAVTSSDPFPGRPNFHGADPTLTGLGAVYTTAINQQLRVNIGVRTDREYRLLNSEVTLAWKDDEAFHYVQSTRGAADDFRYGLAMNPHMRAFITHGRYDLITPYYTTDRLRNLMRLDPGMADRLTVRHFDGGHMFYAWQESRRAFTTAIAEFVATATPRG
ncbi:carboxypeptidase C (cathepsin A) [Amycolatopsis sulphurea]|uniref:Carboxypeptidase C (Cathepsin A) n=1 Tax=Amycolatopsis sulphurea TaxID=76022 RepID=A0A2A9FHE3_9PSEU|nr:peptidase S10 [Amycolatopsis sulphurea]PFG49849.1 carboxypeptidase C (cathepsin A) [Amycolatopsis sulphurea]